MKRFAFAVIVSLGAAVLLATSAVAGYEWFYRDRVLLGVSVHGIDLGALRHDAALARLRERVEEYARKPLVLSYQDSTWELRPAELGASYDLEASVRAARAVGREGSWRERLWERWQAWRYGRDLPLVLNVDTARQMDVLEQVTREAIVPPVPAGLRVVDLTVEVTPSRPGQKLDLTKAATDLGERFAALSDTPVVLKAIAALPPVAESDLDEAKATAERMISAEVRLHYSDQQWVWMDAPQPWVLERSWTVSPLDISRMVDFELRETSQGLRPHVFLDPALARDLGEEIAAQVDRPPRDARLDWNEGDPYPIVYSQEGRRLDVDEFVRLLQQAVLSTDGRRVELPVERLAPVVDMRALEPLDRFVLLEERRTYYGDSFRERRQNVELGAERLNGVVVAPGEVLSFNRAVGEVSAEAGYAMGLSIVGDDTVPDAGGGICQVSTTLFQAAFWAGFPILERAPHAFRIRRYGDPGGLDATVYPPWLDFKFRNTTDDYLLVQAHTQNGWLYVSLYGKDPSWEVEVSEPVVTDVVPFNEEKVVRYTDELEDGRELWVERGFDGAVISIERIVRKDGRIIDRYTVKSSYRPQQNVLLVGTGPSPEEDASP